MPQDRFRIQTLSTEGDNSLPSIPTMEIDDAVYETSESTRTILHIRSKETGKFRKVFEITIPGGWRTDKASVPFPFSAIYAASGRHSRAAICHDRLYREGSIHFDVSRKFADNLFYYIMLADGVRKSKAYAFWLSVRMFGRSAYRRRTRL